MSKNEQSQGQEIKIETKTEFNTVMCPFFTPIKTKDREHEFFQKVSPEGFRQVKVVAYQGKMTQVLCPYRDEGKCKSPERPEDRKVCFIKVEQEYTNCH